MPFNSQRKPLSRPGQIWRIFLKRFMYSQMTIFSGIKIALGKENPLVKFIVEKDPPSIYWVYRIKKSEIENLAQEIKLPENFSLSPIRCLETDEPEYWLTINAYRVSGLANGLRAEWSVFVRDAKNATRYLIIDARSSTYSVDPIDVITKASTVIHEQRDGKIYTQIGDGEKAFRSTITLSNPASPVSISRDWVSANDYIYWGNGICDRTFYDTGLSNAEQNLIGNKDHQTIDQTFWGRFIEPAPVYVLALQNLIEFVISPWENIDKLEVR